MCVGGGGGGEGGVVVKSKRQLKGALQLLLQQI